MDYSAIDIAVAQISYEYWMYTESMRGCISHHMLNTDPTAPVNRYRTEAQIGILVSNRIGALHETVLTAIGDAATSIDAGTPELADLVRLVQGEAIEFVDAQINRDWSISRSLLARLALVKGSVSVHDIRFEAMDSLGRKWASDQFIKRAMRHQIVLLLADAKILSGAGRFALMSEDGEVMQFEPGEYASVRAERLQPNTRSWIEVAE